LDLVKNLTTGLLEAVYDRVPLLAITGMKPTAQIGYAEFQDLNQSRLFAGAGVEWSKDAASPEAVIPLLRDAVATALTNRTCAHLAIPVDIQAAKSPLPLKQFCASKALQRAQPPHDDKELIEETATDLVGSVDDKKIPRNVIAVGLRACNSHNMQEIGASIIELAEALNAPVLTRLDAKGIVDENHPLSFSVIGVHGKPGLASAAAIISSADRVICIGVDDESLLLCSVAGLQIRKVVEIEPDAYGLSTRYEAEHTLVGPISQICHDLALSVETKTAIRNRKVKVEAILKSMSHGENLNEIGEEVAQQLDKFSYMAHLSPEALAPSSDPSDPTSLQRFSSVPNVQAFVKDSNRLWEMLHSGDVSTATVLVIIIEYL
jgi:thiamine pyrophosphate-dependent acetolactate synthase large subunit-like protein